MCPKVCKQIRLIIVCALIYLTYFFAHLYHVQRTDNLVIWYIYFISMVDIFLLSFQNSLTFLNNWLCRIKLQVSSLYDPNLNLNMLRRKWSGQLFLRRRNTHNPSPFKRTFFQVAVTQKTAIYIQWIFSTLRQFRKTPTGYFPRLALFL